MIQSQKLILLIQEIMRALVFVMFMFLIVIVNVEGVNAQVKSGLAKKQTEKKIDVVELVQNAKSLDEINEALKSVRFSESEMHHLANEIKRRGLDQKLQMMRQSAEMAKKGSVPTKTIQPDQLLKQKQEMLSLKQSQLLQHLNAQVLSSKPRTNSVISLRHSTSSSTSLAPQTLTQRQVDDLEAKTSSGIKTIVGSELSVTFTSVSDGTVGHEMTVQGSGFGNIPGRVAVVIDRQLFYCPVSNWSNTRVTFRLTQELEQYIGYDPNGRDALLWFKEPGRETGPTVSIKITPDPSTIMPVITSVTPGEIRPGQTVMISGHNFIKYYLTHQPKVEFFFPNGERVSGIVRDSGNEFILVKLSENYGGQTQTQIRMQVINTINLTADSHLIFIPSEEIIHIQSGEYTAQSQPRGGALFFISLFGESHSYTIHDWELKNGWVVEDSHLEVESIGINSGGFYELQPRPGATIAKAIVNVWADAYSMVKCYEHLYIRGPRGVPYH